MTSSTPIGVTVWKCASRYQRHSSVKGFSPFFPPSRFSPAPPSFLPCSTLSSPLPPSLPTIVMVQTRPRCPVCGVIRVDFRHPEGGDRSPEVSEKMLVSSIFKWNLLDESFSTAVLRAIVIFTSRVFTFIQNATCPSSFFFKERPYF